MTTDNWNGLDAGEVADEMARKLGGVWRGYDAGVPGAMEGHQLVARFEPTESGRKVVTAIMLTGAPITSEVLRRVPLASLENTHNLSNATSRKQLADTVQQLPALQRAPGMTADQWSELFAAHYRAWAALVSHPANAIAAEHNIKVATVHSWVHDARLRGALPPAQRRKAAAPKPAANGAATPPPPTPKGG